MKVAVLHNVARGGAHRRLTEQVRRLDADVVEICLATSRPVTDRPVRVPLALRAPAVPRGARRVPLRHLDLAALLLAWRRAAAEARRCGADVVFASPCRFLQAPSALLDRELPPSLYFCDEPRRVDHEVDAAAARNPSTQALYAGLYAVERRLDRTAVARATALVTNSRYTAGQIARAYGRPADPVPLGVLDRFMDGGAPAVAAHVLSVGMLTPGKGHDLAVRAVAAAGIRLPLVVVAPRPEAAEEGRLRALAADLDVALDLRIGVSDEELGLAYAQAHATLYLARAEPLGLASWEAQALGCPVIVSDEGGLPETVEGGRSGFVVQRCGPGAAQALCALDDPALRARMSAAAREHASMFTWARSAADIQARLERLASEPG